MRTCTGDLSGTSLTFTGAPDTLIVDSSGNTGASSLRGTGSAVSNGASTNYTYICSSGNAADCTITANASTGNQSCSVNGGAPAGTACVGVPKVNATGGPPGESGPAVTVNVTAAGTVHPASGVADVTAISRGSNGGNRGNAYIFGDAGDGGAGGGSATASLAGNVSTSGQGAAGLVTESLGGNGGTSAGLLFAGDVVENNSGTPNTIGLIYRARPITTLPVRRGVQVDTKTEIAPEAG